VKPGNVLLSTAAQGRAPLVKITDFGLVRALDQLGGSGRRTAAGTPQYMSPEQIAGGQIDRRSDLYGLGVLLFRMVTGQEPFAGPTVSAVWSQHLFEPPPRPSSVAPGSVPAWLDDLVLRLLAKEPTGRPQSAEEVAAALAFGPGVASLPADEQARLAALRRYRILDTDPEQPFDDLATLAAHVCGTPIALITLLDADRQWFKSRVGVSLRETARDVSFCTHTIRQAEPLVVPDASQDERFAGSPLVCSLPQARFYAGIPLVTPEGHALGALCVMDRVPRQLSADQLSALAAVSRLVLKQMEMRRDLLELKAGLGGPGEAG
jgi:hypothetical protein